MPPDTSAMYQQPPRAGDVRPKIKPLRLVLSWLIAAASLFIAAWIVPNVEIKAFWGALLTDRKSVV